MNVSTAILSRKQFVTFIYILLTVLYIIYTRACNIPETCDIAESFLVQIEWILQYNWICNIIYYTYYFQNYELSKRLKFSFGFESS